MRQTRINIYYIIINLNKLKFLFIFFSSLKYLDQKDIKFNLK